MHDFDRAVEINNGFNGKSIYGDFEMKNSIYKSPEV